MTRNRTNRLIVAAAERLGARAEPISSSTSDYFLRLSVGHRSVLVSKTRSPFLTQVAQTLSNNKHVARELLRAHEIPCVHDVLCDARTDPTAVAGACLRAWSSLVVKPNWGNRGRDVAIGLRTVEGVVSACERARTVDFDGEALVEPELAGINVRVAVVGGRAIAAVEIQRPVLVGDGVTTLRDAIARMNLDERRGGPRGASLAPLDAISMDDAFDAMLAIHGLHRDAVLPIGRDLELPTDEAETLDRTDDIHESWLRVAERACSLLGVDVGGVDLRGPSRCFEQPVPGRPWQSGDAALLEVNVLPALHMHALPTAGLSRPVFEAFVAYCLSLPGAPSPMAGIGAVANGLSTSM